MSPEELLAHRADRITHLEHIDARPAVVEPWPGWIRPEVRDLFAPEGADVLWGHQAAALRHLADGRDVVVATGTASGKSLVFQAAGLEALARGRVGSGMHGNRRPTVLYLAPTKALAADQLRRLPRSPHLRAGTVDGDNTREERDWARDHANYVLTNPDTLHHSILPTHTRWARLLSGLTYVVVDECHHYRGVFGAHVSHVLRRLLRLCEHYEASPQVVLTSATVANPEDVALRMTGREAQAIVGDASPQGPHTIALWEPPLVDRAADPQTSNGIRHSALSEASSVLTDLVRGHTRTLAFVRSRRGAELVATRAQERLRDSDPELVDHVATYRGGYLPEERRELEQRLRSGELLGLATTNALELGIDISGLDAVLTVGFPGTRAGLLQQFGRAGRDGEQAFGVMIARDEPIDSYLVHHPEALFDAPVEPTVFDPDNPYVLGPHLAAAAHELPLTEDDLPRFGPLAADGVAALEQAGWLRKRSAGWFWTKRERASAMADLRSAGGAPIQIVDQSTGRVIGTVDAGTADSTVHRGAVYVHQGDQFVVDDYDLEHGVALVTRAMPHFYTQAESTTEVAISTIEESVEWGAATIGFGSVDVSQQVVGYLKRSLDDHRVLAQEPLDLPVRTLTTKAVWWTISPDAVDHALASFDVPGSVHAAEHAAIGLLPLLATCDRWDLGGLSTDLHPDTGQLTVFVYDGHPGGAGFAEHGFREVARWLRTTRDAIDSCPCKTGCPACVVSPKCGNGNEPLDKRGAVQLLDALLADAPAGTEH